MDLLETIKTNYSSIADALIKEQTETKGIVANMTSEMFAAEPVVITSEQLISGSDLKEIEAFSRKKNCVYIITLENENCISEIKTTFELKKKEKKEHEFQWNLPKSNEINSCTLYVGSTQDDLAKRLYQHLGVNLGKQSGSTYALYLSKWWKKEFPAVKISAFQFTEASKTQLQFIEDTFSEILKPMFGKRGPNTK